MSSSTDEVIILDVVKPPRTESSYKCNDADFQNPATTNKLSHAKNDMWTESSESDDCVIIDDDDDDDTDNKIDTMQVKTEEKQDESPLSSLSRFKENGYSALRRSTRCHQKLNLPANQLYKSSSVHRKCSEEKTYEPPKKKSKVMSTTCYQHMVNTRSVTRRLGSEGCVLDPPTPEDELEMREWPAEGMHERPVWPNPHYEIPKPTPQPANELEVSVHHALHAVLAFAAQIGTTLPESGEIMSDMKLALLADETEHVGDKDMDFQGYSKFSEQVTCSDGERESLHKLTDLLIHTGVLYCAVCSVSQKSLANYINSLSVECALNWFEEINDRN